MTFLHQNWYWQKHLSLCLKVCATLFHHWTDAFCIKCYFLLKENKATKNWLYSKREDTSLRKLNISIKKLTFLKMVTICYKNEKNPSKWVFLQDFRFYQWSTHNEKINTCRTNCHIFYRIDNKNTSKTNCHFSQNGQLN